MNSKFKTAVIYARYSSDNQTEQSIEGQLRVCNEYAKTHNIIILETYIDRAMTGRNDNRPDFQRMIKDSSRKEWNYVIVYKLDRFSRNKYEMAVHKKTLRDNGTKVISATEFIPDTPEAIIFESMLEGCAEYYSAELSQKVRRGMNETRQKGNTQGGNLLYGYRIENKKFKIDEEKANAVRFVFKQYSLGVFVKDIIKNLHEQGITHYGKPFSQSTIHNILHNEKYTGIYRFGNEIFYNTYPQIIPYELFENVQNKSKKNKYGKRSIKTDYLLRQKLKCGYCGHSMNAESGTSQNGTVKHYYKCLGRKRKNGCTKAAISKSILENYVLNNLINQLSKPTILNYVVDQIYQAQENQSSENLVLKNLYREQKETETTIKNVMKAIEQGVITNTAVKRLKELEEKQEETLKKILVENSKLSVKITKEEINSFYLTALSLEPKLLINYIVKEIIVFDDKIKIYLNTPKIISPDTRRDFLIFSEDNFIKVFVHSKKPLSNKTMHLEILI